VEWIEIEEEWIEDEVEEWIEEEVEEWIEGGVTPEEVLVTEEEKEWTELVGEESQTDMPMTGLEMRIVLMTGLTHICSRVKAMDMAMMTSNRNQDIHLNTQVMENAPSKENQEKTDSAPIAVEIWVGLEDLMIPEEGPGDRPGDLGVL